MVGLSQSQTSQFLKRMQGEGLLGLRREKNFSFYFIQNQDVLKLLKSMQKIFCKKILELPDVGSGSTAV